MNQKSFIKDIVIVTLAILLLGGGYFYFSKKPTNVTAENEVGIIEGSLSYPSDFIPPMKICSENISTKKQYCTTEHIDDSKYKYGQGYKISVSAGKYYVFATTERTGDYRAYFSQFNCGENGIQKSHDPILVEVKSSVTVSGVDVCDWYNSNFAQTQNKPFVKVGEDTESVYYEGYMRTSGTYLAGNQICFILNSDQENLFPGLKAGADGKKSFCFEPYEDAIKLLDPSNKILLEPKIGNLCGTDGIADVYISGYIAAKSLVPGNYNQAKLETVISYTETGHRYFEQSTRYPLWSCLP